MPDIPDELRPCVPAFEDATELLAGKVPEELIPEREDLYPSLTDDDAARQRRARLGQDLKEAYDEKTLAVTAGAATDLEKYFIRAAQGTMAGDFLFACIRDPACVMMYNFEKVTKFYLGVPVTPTRCWISGCDGKEVHPYGAHGFHCSGKVTYRHNAVRDIVVSELRTTQRNSNVSLDIHVEPRLAEFNIPQKHTAVDKRAARGDIAVVAAGQNKLWIGDVTVVHPTPGMHDPKEYLEAAEERKFARYLPNYHLAKEQVVPLAFTTLGAWSNEARNFLELTYRALACGDNDKFNAAYNRLRYRLAITIAKGEGSILNWLSYKNQMPQSVDHFPTTDAVLAALPEAATYDPFEGFQEHYDDDSESVVVSSVLSPLSEEEDADDEAFHSARGGSSSSATSTVDDESDAVEEADSSGEESTEERPVVTARRRGTSVVGESAGDTIIKLRSRSIKRSA
jgi:hypothetical protein